MSTSGQIQALTEVIDLLAIDRFLDLERYVCSEKCMTSNLQGSNFFGGEDAVYACQVFGDADVGPSGGVEEGLNGGEAVVA